VIIRLADDAYYELERVLGSGCVSTDAVRVVYDSLPGRAICAATVADGLLWLVVDLDKPSAHRHAQAMMAEAGATARTETPEGAAIRACHSEIRGRAPLTLVG
jgi:hypothetical protein